MSAVDETVEATAVEVEPPRQDIVRRTEPSLSVTPQIGAADLVERLDMIEQAMHRAMKRDVDYGVVPGTDKPTLFKPGAEKLGVLFQLDVQIDNAKTWGDGDHLTVVSRATAFHAPTGARLGYGEGLCTTREKKYAKRKQERVCPECGEAAVIKGKEEYGGGWLCWAKKGGCNAKWADGADEIERQPQGEVDNPDLPDVWNTVIKMAEKRARVDCILAVTGASALFTQDMDDQVERAPQTTTASGSSSRVSAAKPQKTERVATAKQRGLINVKASEAGLTQNDLANVVKLATGGEPHDFESEEAAATWLKRNLDRLPERLVDAVLNGITEAAS